MKKGLEALKEHFKNSKFPCEMDHYLPVVFSPPRDGRQLTEPLPIVGGGQTHNKPAPLHPPPLLSTITNSSDDHDDDEVDGGDGAENDACHVSELPDDHERHSMMINTAAATTGCSRSLNGGVVIDDNHDHHDNDEDDDEVDGDDHDPDDHDSRQMYIVC